MSLPEVFRGRLAAPVIAAPMFLVSGPDLVAATCQAGVAAAFPSLNARPLAQFAAWLARLNAELEPQHAPYGVNLIVHPSNPRLADDLALVVEHKVPFVITSLGHPGEIAQAVHAYGGVVLSDVIHAYHARKVIEAGVDGVICIASGAGGHAGTQSAFSLVREIREFWDGLLVLGGAISDGAGVRAAETLGADLAYLGTRFIATRESLAQDEYKSMLVASSARDIVYTDAVSGTLANFMKDSLARAGYTPERLAAGATHKPNLADEAKAWRDVWSAGHGVATIHDVLPAADLVARLAHEYRGACALPPSPALARR